MPVINKIRVGTTDYQVEDTAAQATLATKENLSNKVTSISSASTDTQYASAKATYNKIEDSKTKVSVDMDTRTIEFMNVGDIIADAIGGSY